MRSYRCSIVGMMIKKEIAILILGILLGATLVFIVTQKTKEDNRKLTIRILENSIAGLHASQNLASSCSKAYLTASACVSNLSSCDIVQESKKLEKYNLEKEEANLKIQKSNKELELIIQEIKERK